MHFRTCIEIKTIAAGSNRFNDELFPSASEIPNRVFIGFLDNDQLIGTADTNPFYFRRLFREYDGNGKPEEDKDIYITSTSLSVQGTDLSGKIFWQS